MDLELLNDACIIPFPNKKILHESYKVGWMLKGGKRSRVQFSYLKELILND